MEMRNLGSTQVYQFVLGSGWISWLVHRADLEAIPMLWHILNGDIVLRFKDFAKIVQFSDGEKWTNWT